MKFTPDLKFLHDESFDEAARMNRLFDDPRVRQRPRAARAVGRLEGRGLMGRRSARATRSPAGSASTSPTT